MDKDNVINENVKIELPALHDNQEKIYNDTHRFRIVCAGRRFGKTRLALIELLTVAFSKENSKSFYIAPTYRQAKMILWDDLKEFLHFFPDEFIEKINESELSVKFLNGSSISLKGSDKEDSIRGVGLVFCVLDEFAMMRTTLFEKIIKPLLTDKIGDALIISTPRGYDHFHKLYQRGESSDPIYKDYKSFHFTSYDNPLLSKEEIDNNKRENSEEYFAQEYLASFLTFTGLIYKDFCRATHIVDPFDIPSSWTRYRSIDYGFTNPFACLWAAIDNDDNIYIYDEYYEIEKTVAENVKAIQKKTGDQTISKTFIDPSVEQRNGQTGLSIRQQIERQGMFVALSNNDVMAGINEVISRLKVNPQTGKPKIFIFRRCFNFISEIESYQWAETKEGQNDKQQPRKHNDHLMDCTKYLCISLSKAIIPTKGFSFIQAENQKYTKKQTIFDMKF